MPNKVAHVCICMSVVFDLALDSYFAHFFHRSLHCLLWGAGLGKLELGCVSVAEPF